MIPRLGERFADRWSLGLFEQTDLPSLMLAAEKARWLLSALPLSFKRIVGVPDCRQQPRDCSVASAKMLCGGSQLFRCGRLLDTE
jgi:hypothetical protein